MNQCKRFLQALMTF